MEATSFDESNLVLGKPNEMTHDQCNSLSVWRGKQADDATVVISCWKLTKEELEEVNKTGRIWLRVCGQTMPPVCLEGISPFK